MTLIEQYILQNNFGKHLGMDFKIIDPGLVHYMLHIKQEHLATPNSVHGGVLSALMDGLLGVTALSISSLENNVVSTIEFKINFLNPSYLNDELIGIGKVVQKGNRLIIIGGDIVCPERNNMIIAKALGTFNTYPAEKAGYTI